MSSGIARADEFSRELETWKSDRVARLTAPDSWLSLIGLHWLQPGDNTIGSAADNSLRFASGPAHLGVVHLGENGNVRYTPTPESGAVINSVEIHGTKTGSAYLDYRDSPPTTVRAGTLSFFVIQRGDRLALRVRDSESERRRNFAGIDYFDADPSWRIVADWVPFETPREIPITNQVGQTTMNRVLGKAVFTREGEMIELLPLAATPTDTLFFIISDGTSGVETYDAARFLYAEPARDGKVILDFNRAQNPPCAFTPFATCPLPPKENRLKLRITAGEKNYRGEAH